MLTRLHVLGLGTAVPPHRIQQHDAVDLASAICDPVGSKTASLKRLYRHSHVHTRHSALLESSSNGVPVRQSFYPPAEDEATRGPTTEERMEVYGSSASALALEAARLALDESSKPAGEVTHLITVSCTGFHAPGVDLQLCDDLELSAEVECTHVGFMGCHGALNALRVADAIAARNPDSCILICAVELCSLHYQYGWSAEHLVSNSLFADGAAAIVGEPRANPRDDRPRVLATGSCRIPNTAELMSWRIGDHGFAMSISPRVPAAIERALRPWIAQWLSGQGFDLSEIDAWAIHPGGPRILDACADALDLSDQDLQPSRDVLQRYGNMSSPTVLFVLDEIRHTRVHSLCVLLAFGPGLRAEATLIELSAHRIQRLPA